MEKRTLGKTGMEVPCSGSAPRKLVIAEFRRTQSAG